MLDSRWVFLPPLNRASLAGYSVAASRVRASCRTPEPGAISLRSPEGPGVRLAAGLPVDSDHLVHRVAEREDLLGHQEILFGGGSMPVDAVPVDRDLRDQRPSLQHQPLIGEPALDQRTHEVIVRGNAERGD